MWRAPACTGLRRDVMLGAVAAVCLLGCGETPDPEVDPTPGGPGSGETAEGPVRLSYVCGNRFLITSAYSVPVEVTYRRIGSEEEGSARLAAAPSEEPALSEYMFETRGRGTVRLFLDGKPVASAENDGTPCTPATPGPSVLAEGASESGQWSAPFDWPVVAVHLSLLPNGKVISFGHGGSPRLWDPVSGTFTTVPSPVLLFCAGHSLLADGRLLVAGGHISNNHGLPNITYLSASGDEWSSGAPMTRGRWYPTTTTMGTGAVVITAGRDEAGVPVTTPEVWEDGSLRLLTSAKLSLPYYPRTFLAPNGKLFVAGESKTTRYLSLSGNGSWSTVGDRKYDWREYGAAVMYDDGKILYVGGGRTTNTAETIDLNSAAPSWQWTGSMASPRRHLNATVLPTGDVLVTGGLSGIAFNDLTTGVHAAELWSPSTGQWTTLASNIVTRGYHATSLLLPDGRVLHTGSGDGAGAPNQRNAEIFSPPYLFQGPRPVIASAPATMGYGTSFTVQAGDSSPIAKVSLIRLGSVTHAFDMNQRYRTLSFTQDGDTLTVAAPNQQNRTPPGHYMLFLVNGDGIPSRARIVKVN